MKNLAKLSAVVLLAVLTSTAQANLCSSIISKMDLKDSAGKRIPVSMGDDGVLDFNLVGTQNVFMDNPNTPFNPNSDHKQVIKVRGNDRKLAYKLVAQYKDGEIQSLKKINNIKSKKRQEEFYLDDYDAMKEFTIDFAHNQSGSCYPEIARRGGKNILRSKLCYEVDKFISDNPEAEKCLHNNYGTQLATILFNHGVSIPVNTGFEGNSPLKIYTKAIEQRTMCETGIMGNQIDDLYSAVSDSAEYAQEVNSGSNSSSEEAR